MRRADLEALREAVRQRRPVVLAVALGRGEARVIDTASRVADIPGAVLAAAAEALATCRCGRVALDGTTWFLRPFVPPVRLAIVGGVHVAQALAPMARLAGLDPVVIDPRVAYATADRFPGVELIRIWPTEGLIRVGLGPRTAVVTLTHDPKIDDPALAAALPSPAFFVGALGSRRSQAERLRRLAELGVAEEHLRRLRGPVGLDIGAEGPAEIAVSIIAEVVATLRRPGAPRMPWTS